MSLYNTHIERLAKLQSVFGFDASQVRQGSADWLMLKLGVLSASNADKIVAKRDSAIQSHLHGKFNQPGLLLRYPRRNELQSYGAWQVIRTCCA